MSTQHPKSQVFAPTYSAAQLPPFSCLAGLRPDVEPQPFGARVCWSDLSSILPSWAIRTGTNAISISRSSKMKRKPLANTGVRDCSRLVYLAKSFEGVEVPGPERSGAHACYTINRFGDGLARYSGM